MDFITLHGPYNSGTTYRLEGLEHTREHRNILWENGRYGVLQLDDTRLYLEVSEVRTPVEHAATIGGILGIEVLAIENIQTPEAW